MVPVPGFPEHDLALLTGVVGNPYSSQRAESPACVFWDMEMTAYNPMSGIGSS